MFNGLEAVPAVNSVENKSMRDVMGNKDDDVHSLSNAGRLHSLEEHAHSASNVYPTGAGGVAVTSGVGAWTLSAGFTEVVPINTITSVFDIHHVIVESLSFNAVYEIVLYAATVEICRFKAVKDAISGGMLQHEVRTVRLPANTQIQAKCMDDAGAKVATFSIEYHVYT